MTELELLRELNECKDRQIENLKAIIKVQEELLESFKNIIKGK